MEQAKQTPIADLLAGALEHYDRISTKACEWNNQIPQAIKFWYEHKAQQAMTAAAPRSPTPRVDALLSIVNEGRIYETEGPITELARELERELTALKSSLEQAQHALHEEQLAYIGACNMREALQEQLTAEREKAAQERRDAERYRWLRANGRADSKHASKAVLGNMDRANVAFRYWCEPEQVDAAIDAALQEKPHG